MAPSLGVEVSPVDVRDAGEIERAVAAFARGSNGGLIVVPTAQRFHRDLIITLAADTDCPQSIPYRYFVAAGGLISYGPDSRPVPAGGGYVDRILKGEKPADLPVQARPSTSWSSTSRPPRRLESTSPRPCSPAPTR